MVLPRLAAYWRCPGRWKPNFWFDCWLYRWLVSCRGFVRRGWWWCCWWRFGRRWTAPQVGIFVRALVGLPFWQCWPNKQHINGSRQYVHAINLIKMAREGWKCSPAGRGPQQRTKRRISPFFRLRLTDVTVMSGAVGWCIYRGVPPCLVLWPRMEPDLDLGLAQIMHAERWIALFAHALSVWMECFCFVLPFGIPDWNGTGCGFENEKCTDWFILWRFRVILIRQTKFFKSL